MNIPIEEVLEFVLKCNTESTRQAAPHYDSPMIGRNCVVRTYSAGVHIGDVVAKSGTNVHLKNSRRLWKWEGAFTLSEVATNGVSKKGTRMGTPVEIELTQAIELIPTTEKARITYESIPDED